MPCYHPLTAWRRKIGPYPDTGIWPITFDASSGDPSQKLTIPCGKCLACKERKAREWSIRCMHESQMHDANCFITLTYDDESLKKYCPTGSLDKREFQLFMKRLRKAIYEQTSKQIRYYACGEYGDKFLRPHYHAAIFGYDFLLDRQQITNTERALYTSATLRDAWQRGHVSIGNLDWASAAYIAGYVGKKQLGPSKRFHYQGLAPEFNLSSRAPGLGSTWLDKFGTDIYQYDIAVLNGLTYRPPKYYDTKYDPTIIELTKHNRSLKTKTYTTQQPLHMHSNQYARLKQRAKRSYETGTDRRIFDDTSRTNYK